MDHDAPIEKPAAEDARPRADVGNRATFPDHTAVQKILEEGIGIAGAMQSVI
jgi:hypothetical protein